MMKNEGNQLTPNMSEYRTHHLYKEMGINLPSYKSMSVKSVNSEVLWSLICNVNIGLVDTGNKKYVYKGMDFLKV